MYQQVNMRKNSYDMSGNETETDKRGSVVSLQTSSLPAEMEVEEDDEDTPCVTKLTSRPCVLFCVYCGLIGYGLFSVVFDWLWARDMLLTDSGLVFGPPRTVTLVFLFLIASIGTVAFVLEITSFSLKVFKGKPLMDEDIAQILTLFLEEVPSITLSLLLSQCREVPMSYYQLAKAGLQILGSGFRGIRCLIRYFRPDKYKYTGWCAFFMRTFILLTALYCGIAACLVFVFTYTTPPEDGADFRPPGTIWEKSYDNGRYFYKSGVYLSHPSYAQCNNTAPWNETRVNWIKLDSITDFFLVEEDDNVDVYFYYNDTTNIIVVENPGAEAQIDECYVTDTTDPSDCLVTYDAACTHPDLAQTSMAALVFAFHPQEQSKTLVFGDIKFRGTYSYMLRCLDMYVDEWGFLTSEGETLAQLQYFKLSSQNYNDTSAFFQDSVSSPYHHYQLDYELANVTDVWLTGYDKCKMTGSLSPNLDSTIDQLCTPARHV